MLCLCVCGSVQARSTNSRGLLGDNNQNGSQMRIIILVMI